MFLKENKHFCDIFSVVFLNILFYFCSSINFLEVYTWLLFMYQFFQIAFIHVRKDKIGLLSWNMSLMHHFEMLYLI